MMWPFRRRKATLIDEHRETLEQLDEARERSSQINELSDDLAQHKRDNHFRERLFDDLERTRRRHGHA